MGERRTYSSAIIARLPFVGASAVVVVACIVPGLDQEFRVEENGLGASSGTSGTGGTSGTSGTSGTDGTSGASGAGGTTSTTSSSGSTTSTTSSSGNVVDAGKDATVGPPRAFCVVEKEKGATVKFCSDFTTEKAKPWGWTEVTRQDKGTLDVSDALLNKPERELVASVTASGGPVFPGAGLRWNAPAVPVNSVLSLRFQVRVDPASDTYSDIALVQVGGKQRGVGLDACDNQPPTNPTKKICLVENDGDGTGLHQGKTVELTAGATYIGEIVATRTGNSSWSSKVSILQPTLTILNERATGFTVDGPVNVVIGAENAGDVAWQNKGSSKFQIDNVVVTVTP